MWSSDTVYAKQNGGQYNWLIEGNEAVPLDQSFWNDLMTEAKKWGLYVYEQDWLFTEYVGTKVCAIHSTTRCCISTALPVVYPQHYLLYIHSTTCCISTALPAVVYLQHGFAIPLASLYLLVDTLGNA
jgi:hypothetical protein